MASSQASLPALGASGSRPSTAGHHPLLWTSASAERLLRPLSRAPELDAVQAAEFDAKRQFTSSHRDLLKMARVSSLTNLHARNKARAVALRAESAAETGKDLSIKLKGVRPSPEAKVEQLSMALNVSMCHLYPQARSQASYFNLFRKMDKDGSGLISYYEFLRMVRDTLKVTPSMMSEAEVQAMWRWVDEDASGTVGAGEFLKLMRKGWQGFLDEQKKLAKESVLWRPNWNPAIYVTRMENSVWAEQTTTLQEKRKFYLDVAQTEAFDRARKLSEAAQKFEQKRLEAEERLRSTEKDLNKLHDPIMAAKLEAMESRRSLLRAASSKGDIRPGSGSSSTKL